MLLTIFTKHVHLFYNSQKFRVKYVDRLSLKFKGVNPYNKKTHTKCIRNEVNVLVSSFPYSWVFPTQTMENPDWTKNRLSWSGSKYRNNCSSFWLFGVNCYLSSNSFQFSFQYEGGYKMKVKSTSYMQQWKLKYTHSAYTVVLCYFIILKIK